MPGQCTRSRAEGDGRSDANQCCDMKADLATIGPEATLKRVGVVGPTRRTPGCLPCVREQPRQHGHLQSIPLTIALNDESRG